MLENIGNFFQLTALPADRYSGIYDIRLVALSYVVAVFASFIALDMAGRLRDKNNTRASALLWLAGGAIAMGAGIWSMHFIGMLSFTIPGLVLQYDLFWTVLSLLVAIFASGFAMYLLKKSVINFVHFILGGLILGFAIASMHYTGMEAMLITLKIRYLPDLFLLSIIVAIVASLAAIMMALNSNKVIMRVRNRVKFGSAIIMGLAISGMHYTGMAASVFTPLCDQSLIPEQAVLDPTILAIAIASVTLMILSIAFFASNYKEALNQQQIEQARQLGMAEISASVLHNVGNVLNSVNVSASTISEKLDSSRTSNMDNLSVLLNEHKHDLPQFLTSDPRGLKVLDYIKILAAHQNEETAKLKAEIMIVLQNIITIKNIIAAQQTLSKTTEMEYIISINELLDESILISGLQLHQEIHLKKNYKKISPILVDKVKLLQVLVNILSNAKDALVASSNTNKIIRIATSVQAGKIFIEIADNGIGILPKNIQKIFYYGFTTKEAGHGFGLNTSALVIHQLGGDIFVKSEGVDMGATFTIVLPYKIPK